MACTVRGAHGFLKQSTTGCCLQNGWREQRGRYFLLPDGVQTRVHVHCEVNVWRPLGERDTVLQQLLLHTDDICRAVWMFFQADIKEKSTGQNTGFYSLPIMVGA